MVDRFYDPTTATFLTRYPANAATRSAYGYLLAELPDPIDDQLADQVVAVTDRLDRLHHRSPPAVDDGFGNDL